MATKKARKPVRRPVEPIALMNICAIAHDVLGIETLETQNSDELDFHILAVSIIREALLRAYEAGKNSKKK